MAALVTLAFGGVTLAFLSQIQLRLVERKLDRLMRALHLDPSEDELYAPEWLKKLTGRTS